MDTRSDNVKVKTSQNMTEFLDGFHFSLAFHCIFNFFSKPALFTCIQSDTYTYIALEKLTPKKKWQYTFHFCEHASFSNDAWMHIEKLANLSYKKYLVKRRAYLNSRLPLWKNKINPLLKSRDMLKKQAIWDSTKFMPTPNNGFPWSVRFMMIQ